MPAVPANLEIEMGADFAVGLTIQDSETGNPINLTGATIVGKVRPSIDSTTVWAEFTSTLDDPTNGKATMSLTGIQTAAIPVTTVSKGVYDVNVTLSDGSKFRAIEGTMLVEPQVSR